MGTDLGLALSFAADANSGLQGNNTIGANSAGGGLKIPTWGWLLALGGAFVLGLAWILRK